jgi:hypothetical protein
MAMWGSAANVVPIDNEPVYVELYSMLQWQTELRAWYAHAIWAGGYFVPRLGHC